MDKILEYIKLIPKGLSNPKGVVEGWINDAKLNNNSLSEEDMDIIIKRRAICEECPLNSINATTSKEYEELYKENYKTSKQSLHCAICQCPIKKKTAALSENCGIEYYNNEHKTNLELKWKAKN